MRIRSIWMCLLGCLCQLSAFAVTEEVMQAKALERQTVTIGVLGYSGKEPTEARWKATANYLDSHIPEYEFVIKALTLAELRPALRKEQLEFILVNPGNYVSLEIEFGATRIATFKARHHEQVTTQFSSVFFTSKDSNIFDMGDLEGRTFAAVDEEAFCGFQLAQTAMLKYGVDAREDVNLMWLGFPHRDIVETVLSGKADAGTVRTGVLEAMQERGAIDLDNIRILEAKKTEGFPFMHSAPLYPEWPLARLPETDETMAKKVVLALLKMEEDDWAAITSGGAGWTIPLDYREVHDVFRALQIGPYEPPPLTLETLWKEYQYGILLAGALFVLVLGMLFFIWRMNKHLNHSQAQLAQERDALEVKIEQRTLELSESNAALQADIQSRIQSEQTLHKGCEILQDLYTISMRYDLSREQRLQSLLDLGRQYLGVEQGLLSRFSEHDFHFCASSPAQNMPAETAALQTLPAPLARDHAQKMLQEKQTIVQHNTSTWQLYIACPVYTSGQLRCLFEFATAKHEADAIETLAMPSELSLRILHLMAHWIGSEMSLMENEHKQHSEAESMQQRFADLTKREKEVLKWVADGESNKSIARLLDISPKTVELHRTNLLRKTQTQSSTQLVKLAVLAGLTR